jgi:hypothetical protein
MPLPFHTPMITVYEKYDDVLIRSPLLFIRGVARVKSIRDKIRHESGAPCFLYAAMHV